MPPPDTAGAFLFMVMPAFDPRREMSASPKFGPIVDLHSILIRFRGKLAICGWNHIVKLFQMQKPSIIYTSLFLLTVSGLFLLDSGEMEETSAQYDRISDPHQFTVFLKEGGWCWFQDPRAIIHNEHLFIGSVQGNGSGSALIGIFDLEAGNALGTVVAKEDFDHDDHNSPVFYPRPNGSVLAMYARHGREKLHYFRISDRKNYLQWGQEQVIDHDEFLAERDKVTYMNLYFLEREGKLYNFYRGFGWNPSFVTSTDHGVTWGEDTHFIESDLEGYPRPYVRYASNGSDTIYLSITDGHPQQFGNSIYYAEFRNGRFYRADGSLIKTLASDGPLQISEAERVYKGTGSPGRGPELSAAGAAWTSSIAVDGTGHPHIAYSVYLSNSDNRYRLASWDGARWIDREVAYGGNSLYDREASYTGLIALDPIDPTVVAISTDVGPLTGEYRGGNHEIYRARIRLQDQLESIQWKQVTQNSPVRNLRPVIVRDQTSRVILWNRGEFRTFRDYQMDTVGLVEPI